MEIDLLQFKLPFFLIQIPVLSVVAGGLISVVSSQTERFDRFLSGDPSLYSARNSKVRSPDLDYDETVCLCFLVNPAPTLCLCLFVLEFTRKELTNL